MAHVSWHETTLFLWSSYGSPWGTVSSRCQPSYSSCRANSSSLVVPRSTAAWCTSRRWSSLGGSAVRKRCHIFTWGRCSMELHQEE